MDDISLLFTEVYDTFLGRIGERHAGVQLGQGHVTRNWRDLIYSREFNMNELNAETIPVSSRRHMLKRKIYDRLENYDMDHAIGVGFVSVRTTQLPDCSISMSNKINLLYKDLFCYHFNYAYTGIPLRTHLSSEPPGYVKEVLNMVRQLYSGMRITSVFESGSEIEGVKTPPVIRKTTLNTKRMEGEGEEDVELVEGGDYDLMLVMEETVSEEKSYVDSRIKINGAIETIESTPGYLRLRLLQNDPAKQDLPHVLDSDTGSYYLKSCACDPMASSEIKLFFKEMKERREWLFYQLDQISKGPAIKHQVLVKINSPDCENHLQRYYIMELDIVGAFRYSKWPTVAKEWLERKRHYGWPSREIIETIKLGGCHIVGTSHPQSLRPDIEFRYSFSNAENMLSECLTHQQKQCYTALKAIVKHEIRELEDETGLEVKIKSYHLKNVFLWACEAISQEDWSQFHHWSKCLLFMIDRLLCCLERRTMPGYFVRKSNLFTETQEEIVNSLINRIIAVRIDPLTAAIRFLKTTVLYRPEHICLERTFARVLRANPKSQRNENICVETLMCWQRLLADFDCGSNPKFGKKASILEAFANWCRSAEKSICLSDCLSQLSLFDVVFLDIIHNFDVDETIIKGLAANEPSLEVLSKLAGCYREFVSGETTVLNTETRNAFIRKACLLYENSLHVQSICSAVEFAIFMYEIERYDECVQLLKSLENISTYIKCENLFHSRTVNCFIKTLFKHKIDNRINGEDICIPSISIVLLLFVLCHINMDSIEEAFPVMERFEQYFKGLDGLENYLRFYIFGFCKEQMGMQECGAEYFRMALQCKLLTMTQRVVQGRNGELTTKKPCPHFVSLLDLVGLSTGVGLFASESEANNLLAIRRQRWSEIPFCGSFVVKFSLFLTANYKSSSFGHCRNIFSSHGNAVYMYMLILITRWSATQHIPSSSNLLYYAHLVMLYTMGESVLSVLLDVVTREEDAPLSVIVWPKQFRILADDCIRREIDKADDREFVVIPSLTYAYYLLAKLYLRLGKMDSFSKTMAKFEELCRKLGDACSVSCSLLAHAYHQHLNPGEWLFEYQDTNSCARDRIEDDIPCSDVAKAGPSHVFSSASAVESADRSFRRSSYMFELMDQIFMNIMGPMFNTSRGKLLNEQMKHFAEEMADATSGYCVSAA